MDKNPKNEMTIDGVDTRLLTSLVVELNIARRNFRSYPPGHPLIDTSLKKVIEFYDQLLKWKAEVVIGVARDALMVNNILLDKNNQIFRAFARTLFEHGIGALLLHRGLTAAELKNFTRILCLKRDEVLKRGGISLLWEQAGMTSLRILPIRYDLFSVTESSPEEEQFSQGLWVRFVRRLAQGAIITDGINDGFGDWNDLDEIDPQLLAEILNRQFSSLGADKAAEFSSRAGSSFAELTYVQIGNETELSTASEIPYQKLATFINCLNPELRRQFLSSSFDMGNLIRGSLAEEIVPLLSAATVNETLADIKENRFTVPPVILNLLEKLSRTAEQQRSTDMLNQEDEIEIHQKIRDIFREHAIEDFVPDSYREKLEQIVSLEQSGQDVQNPFDDLMDTLDNHYVENHISDIILQMLALGVEPEQSNLLVGTLFEIYFYLLQTGDYDQLLQLVELGNCPEIPPVVRESLASYYASRKWLDEVLVGLTTWGKTRYDDIARLIRIIGEPFIEVLLDRLADEENLSLRRFLMDRIQEFGMLARDAIVARLSDSRWYVLRNLILMLRLLDDISVLEDVRPLLNNPHPRVRQEAIRFCLQFNDPAAARQILYGLDSPDRETKLASILLAEKSRSADVFKKLLAIIAKSGFSSIEYELKSAAVNSLAEIGRADALPELARVLASKSLLNSRLLSRLKIDIVRSLSRYPPSVALPILTKLASGSGDIGRQATVSLKVLMEKTS